MNIVLSKDNHFKIGYNQIPSIGRSNRYDKFFTQYGKIKYIPKNFREAAIQTAIEISDLCNNINRIPLIMYSGGISSEIILASFLESKRKFEVAHIKYIPDVYSSRTNRVQEFCRIHNLYPRYFNIELDKFFNDSIHIKNAVRDNAYKIDKQFLTSITLNIRDTFFPVSNHFKISMNRTNSNLNEIGDWIWKDYECHSSYFNHCYNENLNACPSFHRWSPEIMFAFLIDPEIINLIENRTYGKVTVKTTIPKIYHNAFPEYDLISNTIPKTVEYVNKSWSVESNRYLKYLTYYDKINSNDFNYYELLDILGNMNV